ncbi:MAG TPA: single-stranded DNA-binding protein [Archangium sp.]
MKNLVILIGNLGKNPELRNTGKTSVANFSVATSESFKDADGKPQKSTEWHNVAAFGTLADTVAKYLKKGSKVYIEGRLKTRKWEDKEGVTRYSTEVIANEVKFLDAKRDDADKPEAEAEAA